MTDDGAGVPVRKFQNRLQTLKQLGCNVLVTGKVGEGVSQQMTRKLLGATEEPRTRILALTDQDREDVPDLLPGDVAPDDQNVYVVDYGGTRTATAASAVGAEARWHRTDLDALRTRLCDAIATAKIAQSGFDPAELRISVFTLSYLLNQHDAAAVDRFVDAISDHVRGIHGIVHYHLPIADDSKPVRRLSPLFDARVELREKHGQPEQRWHFSDDEATVWLGL